MSTQPISARLDAIQFLADRTNLYTFKALNSEPLPPYTAGAHIDVELPNAMTRQYSLVAGGADGLYQVGVKHDVNSRGGSRYIHEKLKVGDRVKVSSPRNNFPLEESAAHTVLIAGGIGITPIWTMAQRLAQLKKSWTLHYAVRQSTEACFTDVMAAFPGQVHLHVDEEQGGPLDLVQAVNAAPRSSEFYCCGPIPMLNAFKSACSGVSPDHVHVEYFAAELPAAARTSSFKVIARRSKLEVDVKPGMTILGALKEAGVSAPSSCEQGVCGACETVVLEGEPDHRDAILSDKDKQKNRTMMICCSLAKSRSLVLDI